MPKTRTGCSYRNRILTVVLLLAVFCSGCGAYNEIGVKAATAASLQTEDQSAAQREAEMSLQTEDPADAQEDCRTFPGRIWMDSLGREVQLPERVERVALAGPLAQIVLYALAPEKLVGYSSDWTADEEKYIPEEYRNLPNLGQLYGGKGEMNLEELLAAAPDVVIDVGQTKEGMAGELDALSEQTGIPFVHVTMTLENAGEAFRQLGDLLSLQERAEEYAQYCETVYLRAKKIAKQAESGSGRGGKKKALCIVGADGLHVIAKESYHSEILDLFTENLAVLSDPSSKGTGNEVDMEQILNWNPEVIIFGPDSIYDTAATRPEWQNIPAVRDKAYYEIPFGPYNWMGFPPSVQRYLGMLWLPKVLYPELCEYDLKEEVVKYYRMFYHCELNEAQYERLIHSSGFDRTD